MAPFELSSQINKWACSRQCQANVLFLTCTEILTNAISHEYDHNALCSSNVDVNACYSNSQC